jgi:hypothetical protein
MIDLTNIAIIGSMSGMLGALVSHSDWLLKLIDNGAINKTEDARSSMTTRLIRALFTHTTGAIIGFAACYAAWGFNILDAIGNNSNFEYQKYTAMYFTIGFFSSLLYEEFKTLIKKIAEKSVDTTAQ